MSLKRFARYVSPRAVNDLDAFLDDIPKLAGTGALAGALALCLFGALAVWFAAGEMRAVSALRGEMIRVEALKPPVPQLGFAPVSQKMLKAEVEKIADSFKGLSIAATADGEVTLSAPDTDYFQPFLMATGDLRLGGRSRRVSIKTLCVGRECKGPKLSAVLRVEAIIFK